MTKWESENQPMWHMWPSMKIYNEESYIVRHLWRHYHPLLNVWNEMEKLNVCARLSYDKWRHSDCACHPTYLTVVYLFDVLSGKPVNDDSLDTIGILDLQWLLLWYSWKLIILLQGCAKVISHHNRCRLSTMKLVFWQSEEKWSWREI